MMLMLRFRPASKGGCKMSRIDIRNANFLLGACALLTCCLASGSNATPLSPGLQAGRSICDLQQLAAQGRQVSLNGGSPLVHVVWVDMVHWPDSGLYPSYSISMFNTWDASTSAWRLPPEGCYVGWSEGWLDAGSGVNIGIKSSGLAEVADNSQRNGSLPWSGPRAAWIHKLVAVGYCVFTPDSLTPGPFVEPIFPKIDIDQNPSPGVDIFHIAGCDTTTSTNGIYYFVYWRFDGAS